MTKQVALEEHRRMEEFEKEPEVKRKIELVQDEAERLKIKAEERRDTGSQGRSCTPHSRSCNI